MLRSRCVITYVLLFSVVITFISYLFQEKKGRSSAPLWFITDNELDSLSAWVHTLFRVFFIPFVVTLNYTITDWALEARDNVS